MKGVLIVAAIAVFTLSCTGQQGRNTQAGPQANGPKRPVLVELFTSEGCSSCPPADALLNEIATNQQIDGTEVIALEQHVDYWDTPSWRDPFSSAGFTSRQEAYARQLGVGGTYTPQAVVDGGAEMVGSDRDKLSSAIASRRNTSGCKVSVSFAKDKLHIDVADIPANSGSTIYLAVTESGLKSHVGGGENAGLMLSHAPVVRNLGAVGTIDAGQRSASLDVAAPTNADWNAGNVRYVVFVQDSSSLKILGAAQVGH